MGHRCTHRFLSCAPLPFPSHARYILALPRGWRGLLLSPLYIGRATVSAKAEHYAEVYRRFQAPISKRLDCGKKCAPRNDGIPACCDIERAVPIVDDAEWRLLKQRTDLWKRLRPSTPSQKRE